MRTRLLKAALFCLMPFLAFSQHSISGKVMDSRSNSSLPRAHITVENTHIVVFSDINGYYEIRNIPAGTYQIKCTYIGYTPFLEEVHISSDLKLDINIVPHATLTDEVIISATRSSIQSPITQTIINKTEIQNTNLGQDLPILLKMTPSVVVSSDAGMGIGYTGINIRGSDATRINVTINGIPVNDSESHGVWWVNMPDFISSTENIQIQRGVGSSTNGAAAFGASVNLQTNTLNEKRYAEISNAAGSFNSMKNTISFGTGLLPGKWAFDGRMSRIVSDGYIDRASSSLSSYYLSGGYYGEKSILKLIHFSGREKTYQAWYGLPKDSLNTNRTFNPAGMYYDSDGKIQYYDNETDNYQQDHYQIHYSYQLHQKLTFNSAGHYTYGRGYYEQYRQNDRFSRYDLPNVIIGNDTITRTDLIRQRWLDNNFYGLTYSFNYNSFSNFNAILGGGYNIYDGDHFGEIVWAEISKDIPKQHRYYDNNGYKKDLNNFIKAHYQIGKMNIFGDLQHRRISYSFVGKAIINNNVEDLGQEAIFNFINPKAGITYSFNPQSSLYAYWGVANREPVRKDFTESSPESRPKHETLNNFEIGYKKNKQRYFFGVNAYLMSYENQLVLTGEINDVGDYTRTNIDGSYRAGIEFESNIKITDNIQWGMNFTYSQNKIKDYTEYYDAYDSNWNWAGTEEITYKNTNISFSPDIIAGSFVSYKPINNLNINLYSKYVGAQYIDNTSNKDRMLSPYFINDINIAYKKPGNIFESIEFIVMLNNIFNEYYISNAWVYNGIVDGVGPVALGDGYFPQAGRHYMVGLNIKF